MYVSHVKMVQMILLVAVLFSFPGCASSKRIELPPEWGQEGPSEPTDEEEAEPQTPRGCVGDPQTLTFHRVDCPHVEKVDRSTRKFYVTPFAALNDRYHPCDYCEPLSGWE